MLSSKSNCKFCKAETKNSSSNARRRALSTCIYTTTTTNFKNCSRRPSSSSPNCKRSKPSARRTRPARRRPPTTLGRNRRVKTKPMIYHSSSWRPPRTIWRRGWHERCKCSMKKKCKASHRSSAMLRKITRSSNWRLTTSNQCAPSLQRTLTKHTKRSSHLPRSWLLSLMISNDVTNAMLSTRYALEPYS